MLGRNARERRAHRPQWKYQDWFERHRATPEQVAVMRVEARKFAHQP